VQVFEIAARIREVARRELLRKIRSSFTGLITRFPKTMNKIKLMPIAATNAISSNSGVEPCACMALVIGSPCGPDRAPAL